MAELGPGSTETDNCGTDRPAAGRRQHATATSEHTLTTMALGRSHGTRFQRPSSISSSSAAAATTAAAYAGRGGDEQRGYRSARRRGEPEAQHLELRKHDDRQTARSRCLGQIADYSGCLEDATQRARGIAQEREKKQRRATLTQQAGQMAAELRTIMRDATEILHAIRALQEQEQADQQPGPGGAQPSQAANADGSGAQAAAPAAAATGAVFYGPAPAPASDTAADAADQNPSAPSAMETTPQETTPKRPKSKAAPDSKNKKRKQ